MTDIDLNDELEKLLKSLTTEEKASIAARKAANLNSEWKKSVDEAIAIALSADPCLRVVTQFMEGVEEDA
jgi:DNA-binding transcriptional regulator YhcF (GntR family)